MYEDRTLVCNECGQEFTFTAGEQEFYAEKGFANDPKKCKACRDARKNAGKAEREMFTATCARCGKEARVLLSLFRDIMTLTMISLLLQTTAHLTAAGTLHPISFL